MANEDNRELDITGIVRALAKAAETMDPSHQLNALANRAADLVRPRPSFDSAARRAGWVHLSAQDDHDAKFWHEATERFVEAADYEELCLIEGIAPVMVHPDRVYVIDDRRATNLEFDQYYVSNDYVTPAILAGAVCDERGWYMADSREDLDAGAIVAYPTAKALCEDLDIPWTSVDLPVVLGRDFQGAILLAEATEIDGADLESHLTPEIEVAPTKPTPAAPRMGI